MEFNREERPQSDYEAVFERAAEQAGRRIGGLLRDVAEAPALLAELLSRPAEVRASWARSDPKFCNLKLCELLTGQARAVWSDDPVAAVDLAGLAVEIADRLDPCLLGTSLVEDARALAWAHLGNAYRVASDLRRAEEALARAEEHHQRAGADAFTEAEIVSFTASLRSAQGHFDAAVRLLDRALGIYRASRDRRLEGRTLIKKGMIQVNAGLFQEAIQALRRGLSLIDAEAAPRLVLAARHNLLWCLSECGRHQEALEALEVSRQLYHDLGDRMYLVRLRWVEGRIAWALGRLDEAGAALREVRDSFIERGLGYDAAMASLDLAMLHARSGDLGQVKRLAAEMVPIFESRDLHHNAIAALLVFQEAAQAERVTLTLLDQIVSSLKKIRRNPEARFELEN